MLSLSKKANGFFIEINEREALMARTSSTEPPMVIEEIREAPRDDETLRQSVRQLVARKSGSGYIHARCGVYPPHRIIRRVTLDLKRLKEPAYFGEICSQQFRIEADKCTLAVLHASDGTDYDISRVTSQKEVVFAGGPNEELLSGQEHLLALGVYPERLELGTIATVGAVVNYHAFAQLKTPTLLLEMDADSTQTFIVTSEGLDVARPVPQGIEAMVPVIQKELNLKDEASARKLFFSNTFDFTNMGGLLVKKLLKELQSLIGFYEVQTGQSIGQVLCTRLPPKLGWLSNAVAKELGVGVLQPDLPGWLKSCNITLAPSVASQSPDLHWLGLLGLMVYHNAAASEKK